MEPIKLKTKKRQRLSSLLGLTLDGSRLDGVVLRRTDGSLQVQQSFSVTLSLDPLTAEAELVGREIRNHLDAAGVRERNCVVGLPLKWALTAQAEIPKLEAADLASFLQLEAERGFPCDVSTLLVCNSRCNLADGKAYAMMVGIPRTHLERLERALEAAKLKPVNFTLGLAALQPMAAAPSKGVMALVIGESAVELQVTCAGGIASLRMLEGGLEVEGGRKALQPDLVAREARITLGQLPAELRDAVHLVRIFGPRDLGQQLADEIDLRFEAMGLKVEYVARYAPGETGLQLPADAPVSAALSLAATWLAERESAFDFLPPKVTRFQQITAKYGSSKLRTAGAIAALLLLLVGSAFGFQQIQLVLLGSEWNGMQKQVKDIEGIQTQITRFRPWSDTTMPSLTVLKVLSQSFPAAGAVSAKTVEIRDQSKITCAGLTKDIPSLLTVIDQLRTNNGVSNVRQPTIRGNKSPMQFTFEFQWNEADAK
jgi:hypothetical protein